MIQATKRRGRGRALTADDRRLTDDERDAVEANLGLVYTIARQLDRPDAVDDRVQDGVFGLARAVQTVDPARGKLSTHAGWHIRQAVGRARQLDRLVHVPIHLFRDDGGGSAECRAAKDRALRVSSYDSPPVVKDGSGGAAESSYDPFEAVDPRTPDPADEAERAEAEARALNALRAAVAELPDRERNVVERRLTGETLEAVGRSCGFSRDRASTLEHRAHKRLRAALAEYA